jgi:hypothetical protein
MRWIVIPIFINHFRKEPWIAVFLTLLRLTFSTVALPPERSAAVAKPSRSNINGFERGKFPEALLRKFYPAVTFKNKYTLHQYALRHLHLR